MHEERSGGLFRLMLQGCACPAHGILSCSTQSTGLSFQPGYEHVENDYLQMFPDFEDITILHILIL
jgi:hypothetical protein